MKLSLLFVFLIAMFAPVQGQNAVAIPLDEIEERAISIALLDSLHGPAAHIDPAQSVFPTQQDEVFDAWRALLATLSEHLLAEGFEWTEPLQGYYRFYFRPDGTVERVLYRVQKLEGERLEQFGHILDEFARSYRFALSAEEGFAQCSPATLMPPTQ